ncbi:MAG TPA: SPOR domain-containing protein, partial [Candidatus Dormibacteraeota bacterium]|nr:SPOR domain-containing protein [Candidatus Dormibacteraeota bacterium]
ADLVPEAIPVAAAPPPPVPAPAPPPAMVPVAAPAPVVASGGSYSVHVGVDADYERARREQRRLDGAVGPVRLALIDAPEMRFYQLRVGPFANRAAAERAAQRLADLGAPALVVVSGR